jgi:carboxyl-terminal processing protease
LAVRALAAAAQTGIDTGSYFKAVRDIIAFTKQQKGARDVTLDMASLLAGDYFTERDENDAAIAGTPTKKFIVQNNGYELERIQSDAELKEMNDEFSKQIAADAYISIAYDVLTKMKP